MKTIFRFAWLAPVLALGITLRGAAQDAESVSGKILILSNDRVFEGDIERVGSQFRIRRGIGETLIAADRTKRLCSDWSEALAYLRGQANLGDPDERLRLARWCHENGLKDDAVVEIHAALEMRPTHNPTKQFAQILERAVAPPVVQPRAVGVTSPKASSQLDLSADSVALFNTRVQPILLNACAGCHAAGQAGDFQLLRPGDSSARAVNQRNLAATVAQLKIDNPAASPLVVKAVSAHGGAAQAPLRDRRAAAAQTLQQWAEQVAANNPHLLPTATNVAAARPAPSAATAAPAAISTPVVSRTVERPVNELIPEAAVTVRDALLSKMRPVQNPAAAAFAAPTVNSDSGDAFNPRSFNNLPPRK